MLPPCQRRHQHDERGFRQVEVGDEGVRHLEAVARIDKDIRPAGAGPHGAVLPHPGFYRAAGGGAHADDAPAIGTGTVDEVGCLLGDDAVLAVHLMLGDFVLLHRTEGAKAHVQRHIANANAHGLHLFQQLLRKMQARRGCGGAAHHLGIHRLVALAILQFLLDIRRQGHFAQPIQHLKEDALIVEPHQPVAAGQFLRNLGSQLAVAKGELRAFAHFLAGPHQTFPRLVAPVDQQQHLARAAARQTLAQQPCRKHAGIIEDQAVPRPQKIRQLIKMMVLDFPGNLIKQQQSRPVPSLKWGLGDQLLRQIKIEVMCFHISTRFSMK